MKKTALLLISLVLFSAALVGCGNTNANDSNEKKSLKIGCMTSSQSIVEIMKEGLAKEGYEVEVVLFDANNMPATALKDGNIDGVVLNHKVWIDTFNKQNGSNLVMIKPYLYYSPMRLYSKAYDKASDLPQNSKIVVPSDPANLDRSLQILQDVDLIKLGTKTGDFYTKIDMTENKQNITLVEAEITTAARSINDAEAVISPAFYIAQDKVVDVNDFIYEDPRSKDYPLGLIVDAADEKAAWAKIANDYVNSDKGMKTFNDTYKGTYILFKDVK